MSGFDGANWQRDANLCRSHGDLQGAGSICLRQLAEHPSDAVALAFAKDLAADKTHSANAIAFAQRLVAAAPDQAWAHYIHAIGCSTANQLLAAVASCDRALELQPDFAEVHSHRGGALLKLGRRSEALGSCLQATSLSPEYAPGWAGLGRVFDKLKQYKLAIGAYRRALDIDPHYPFLKGRLLQQRILICDWRATIPLIAEIEDDLSVGRKSARPFAWQAVSTSPRSLQACAQLFNAANERPTSAWAVRRPFSETGKIRLGYVSGELREHSTAYLRVGVFENQDRDRFEVIAFDNGWDDGGNTRARINRAIDRIIDIKSLSDDQVADLIERERIDILVDLNGFNGRHRMGVFALRPAPVQVTFPGYPGTLGADYIDYILADQTIIPPEQWQFYNEQPAIMPDCYQANDCDRPISKRSFSRAELGLPEVGVVFCCFNNNYKIMPPVFDAWVRILRSVPGSVLWLLSDNAAAVTNLRAAAMERGLDPARLMFAERMPVADHLARHRAADLFLDTLPCNAHATASDALWSGLPVLTCLGETFSGRVAASLLRAIDLPELVTHSLDDYERKAIYLGNHPGELAQIRQKLADKRRSTPLFDTLRFTRHLESAYAEMARRARAGEQPRPLIVSS
jgi:predicted O-linked N-acetylglucosamine transferase (SPINDLY family)